MINRVFTTLLGAAAIFAVSAQAGAADYRVHGSATVGKGIIAPNQAKIESNFGKKLSVIMNGSGNGLKDLAAGKADIAMISADLAFEVKNAKAGNADFRAVPVGKKKISFIVHPSNGVTKLTAEQVKGILSGKITNWSEVGGTSATILVVAEVPGQGTRASVEIGVLGGQPIGGKPRTFKSLSQVAKVVSQAPNAFGYGNSSSITGKVKQVEGVEADQPLSLVTIGAPNDDQVKFIAAVKGIGE